MQIHVHVHIQPLYWHNLMYFYQAVRINIDVFFVLVFVIGGVLILSSVVIVVVALIRRSVHPLNISPKK